MSFSRVSHSIPGGPKNRKPDSFGKIARLIKSHKSFIITTHLNPDGDGLGSQSALLQALEKMGKKVTAVNHDKVPRRFEYLDFRKGYRTADHFAPHEVCFTLDAGDLSRIRAGINRNEFGILVNIDHHYFNSYFGDYNLVFPKVSATGEIVFRLIRALGVPIDRGIAESLYTSIATDTGGFRYSNTSPQLLRLVARLVESGAEPQKINDKIFADYSREALELIRISFKNVKIHLGGRLASMTLSKEEFKRSGAFKDETENLINFLRILHGVEVAFFLHEQRDGQVKLSLKSGTGVNVAVIAKEFGGGGHSYAAGALLSGPLSKVFKQVLGTCLSVLKTS